MSTLTVPPSRTKAYSRRYAKMYKSGYRLTTDATVTRRMLQALRCIGYSSPVLGVALNLTDRRVRDLTTGRPTGARHTGESVYLSTARAVEDFYWAHHMKPRSDRGAKKCITAAKAAGWAPPLAWDDITDITEEPKQ